MLRLTVQFLVPDGMMMVVGSKFHVDGPATADFASSHWVHSLLRFCVIVLYVHACCIIVTW